MRVLTRLPRGLLDQLAELDPLRVDTRPSERPNITEVMTNATVIDADDVPPRRPITTAAIAGVIAVVVVVAGIAAVVTLSTGRGHGSVPPTRPSPSSGLYGVIWLNASSQATVVFSPGSAYTSDGCDSETQVLTVRGARLRLGKDTGGGSACGGVSGPAPGTAGYPAFQRQRAAVRRFHRVLSSTPRFAVHGARLTLTAPNGDTIRLISHGKDQVTLPRTHWSLQNVLTVGRITLGTSAHGSTLEFGADGSFTANDSCNELSGTAHLAAADIGFRITHRTHRRCSTPGHNPVITTIDTLLSGEVTYTLVENHLHLAKPGTHASLDYQLK